MFLPPLSRLKLGDADQQRRESLPTAGEEALRGGPPPVAGTIEQALIDRLERGLDRSMQFCIWLLNLHEKPRPPLTYEEASLMMNDRYDRNNWYKCYEVAQQHGILLWKFSDRYRMDPFIVLTACTNNGLALEYALGDLENNRQIVLAAVTQNGMALQFADPDETLTDVDIVMAAVKQNGMALEHTLAVSHTYDIVLAAVTQNGLALNALLHDNVLRANPTIVTTAVKSDAEVLKYVHSDLRGNKEMVYFAVCGGKEPFAEDAEARIDPSYHGHGGAFKYASDELKDDDDFVFSLVSIHANALQYASRRLKELKHIVLEAMRPHHLRNSPTEVMRNHNTNPYLMTSTRLQADPAVKFMNACAKLSSKHDFNVLPQGARYVPRFGGKWRDTRFDIQFSVIDSPIGVTEVIYIDGALLSFASDRLKKELIPQIIAAETYPPVALGVLKQMLVDLGQGNDLASILRRQVGKAQQYALGRRLFGETLFSRPVVLDDANVLEQYTKWAEHLLERWTPAAYSPEAIIDWERHFREAIVTAAGDVIRVVNAVDTAFFREKVLKEFQEEFMDSTNDDDKEQAGAKRRERDTELSDRAKAKLARAGYTTLGLSDIYELHELHLFGE
jgi:hypothetical protein